MIIKEIDSVTGMLVTEDLSPLKIKQITIDRELFCLSCRETKPLWAVNVLVEGYSPAIKELLLCQDCIDNMKKKEIVDKWLQTVKIIN